MKGLRLLAPLLALAASPARADRAILIGVGDYPQLAASLRLQAPEEDVRRIAAALEGAGFARDKIVRMTVSDGASPTRAAVLDALDAAARGAASGEQVLVYFSGHGAQAPTLTPALEPDGLDELYLMHDARTWDGGAGRVPGAILDKELAARIDAIRAKGADVWFVADSCHAGGAFRGAGDVRTKAVGQGALGIPPRVRRTPAAAPPAATPAGKLAAFFAAAPGALAIERRLPLGSPDARPLSQFSYALVRAIAAGRLRSLRDLAVAIEATDAGIGGGAPQPVFEGALDMSVLGLPADRPRRYPLTRDRSSLTMPAGIEEGFAVGDRVRLLARDGAAGEATITEVALGASRMALAPNLPGGAIEAERVLGGASGEGGLLAAIAPLTARGAAQALDVTARLWRPGAARTCPAVPDASPKGSRPAAMLALPPLGQCDVLIASIVNRGSATVDISPIYIDAGGRLSGLGFLGGGSARIAPGERRHIAIRALIEDRAGKPLPHGIERLAIVALPAVTRSPRDLRGSVAAYRSGDAPKLDAGAGALTYRWRIGRNE